MKNVYFIKFLATILSISLAGCGGGQNAAQPSVPTQPSAAAPVLALFAGNVGGSAGNADGTGGAASFSSPKGVATDSNGNIYVADSSNGIIRKITPTGVVSTLGGSMGTATKFFYSEGIATDGTGNVYVTSDSHSIFKISPSGVVSTLAGSADVSGTDDGAGTAARFKYPQGLATDKDGNLYVADTGNNSIRKITPAGVVSTLAGSAGISRSADGTGSAATFRYPSGVAVDNAGNIYVTDFYDNIIRKITPGSVVSTLAGSAGVIGNADGLGSAALFHSPQGIATDGAGNIYVADAYNNTIRKVNPVGLVSTLAGAKGVSGGADGAGPAALFNSPQGIAIDSTGNIYVADTGNNAIRKILSGGLVSTLAGAFSIKGTTDGNGAEASFAAPQAVAADLVGNIYVADTDNCTIRKISSTGMVSTLAGMAGACASADGTGASARFGYPQDIATDATGNIYVVDRTRDIRKISPTGVVSTLAKLGTSSSDIVTSSSGIACDGAGNVYVAEVTTTQYTVRQPYVTGSTIRKITPDGVTSILAGSASAVGSADGIGSAASFNYPHGMVTDTEGNVFVSDTRNSSIRKITPAGMVTTLARARDPYGIAIDSTGSIYVTDWLSNTVSKITASGAASTIVGVDGVKGFTPGPLPGALSGPIGVAISGRSLYIAFSNGVAVVHNVP